jgi:exosome complex exonuclease RRP6
MFYYARSDTHFLLYIYDMLRNELVELAAQDSPDGNPIDRVIQKSKEVSLQRYEHPFCDSETGAGNRGWYNTLIKSPTLYNGEQFAVYKAVHKWRDDVARQEDESSGYIMTQQVLSDIARIMPTDMKALWSLLESNARRLKARLGELFEVIQAARARGANGPTMLEFFRQSSTGTVQTGDKQQAVATAVEDGEPLSIEELKSDRSQLWGDVALNSTLDGTSKARPISDQEMIPLYTFDFGAIKEELPQATEPPPKPAPKQDAGAAPVVEDQGFTLKTGRKRKASDADVEPASDAESASDIDMDGFPSADQAAESPDAEVQEEAEDAEATKKATKQAKKVIRKEYNRVLREVKALIKKGDTQAAEKLKEEGRKTLKAGMRSIRKGTVPSTAAGSPESSEQPQQQQQASEEQGDEQEEEEDDEQPFDYGAASSVLHASKNNGGANNNASGGGRGGKGGKKRGGGRAAAFDPYAKKSGDAPAGARKMNYEKAGRTATFKK